MYNTKVYKLYRRFVYIALILCFGTSIYFYNENQTLRKIILTNTDMRDNHLIDATIEDIQHYDATGELPPDNRTKPLDKILQRVFESSSGNKTIIECNQTTAVCRELEPTD